MGYKKKYDESEIDHWITVKGARIPVLKDGTLGIGTLNGKKGSFTDPEYKELHRRTLNITEKKIASTSRNAKYDTSRVGKKKPSSLEAFKENSNQFVQALKQAEKQGALEFEFTDMTGKVFHRWWDGAKFVDKKVSQSMERRYGKRSGTFKSSFKKPDDWE